MTETQSLQRRSASLTSFPQTPSRPELLQLISDGYILLDRNFRIRDVNAAALRLVDRSRCEVIDRGLWEIFPDIADAASTSRWIEAMEGENSAPAERVYGWDADGPVCLELVTLAVGDGLAVLCRDVTGREKSSEDPDVARAALLQASRLRAVGAMAVAMAHEMAQPLTSARTAIAASLMLLKRRSDADMETARNALELARASVQRTGDLLKRVRTFVGKGQIRLGPHDLERIVTEAAALSLPQARLSGVAMSFDFDPRARRVEVEPLQIEQVLVNLIESAMATVAEAPAPHLSVSTRILPTEQVEVAIMDEGPGRRAPPESLFARPSTEDQEELELGLAISRTILQAHGSRLQVGHSPAGGICFRFSLASA